MVHPRILFVALGLCAVGCSTVRTPSQRWTRPSASTPPAAANTNAGPGLARNQVEAPNGQFRAPNPNLAANPNLNRFPPSSPTLASRLDPRNWGRTTTNTMPTPPLRGDLRSMPPVAQVDPAVAALASPYAQRGAPPQPGVNPSQPSIQIQTQPQPPLAPAYEERDTVAIPPPRRPAPAPSEPTPAPARRPAPDSDSDPSASDSGETALAMGPSAGEDSSPDLSDPDTTTATADPDATQVNASADLIAPSLPAPPGTTRGAEPGEPSGPKTALSAEAQAILDSMNRTGAPRDSAKPRAAASSFPPRAIPAPASVEFEPAPTPQAKPAIPSPTPSKPALASAVKPTPPAPLPPNVVADAASPLPAAPIQAPDANPGVSSVPSFMEDPAPIFVPDLKADSAAPQPIPSASAVVPMATPAPASNPNPPAASSSPVHPLPDLDSFVPSFTPLPSSSAPPAPRTAPSSTPGSGLSFAPSAPAPRPATTAPSNSGLIPNLLPENPPGMAPSPSPFPTGNPNAGPQTAPNGGSAAPADFDLPLIAPEAAKKSSDARSPRDPNVALASASATAAGTTKSVSNAAMIVARVGVDAITFQELNSAVNERVSKYIGDPQMLSRAERDMMGAQILSSLIERSLLLQEMRRTVKDPKKWDLVRKDFEKRWNLEELPIWLRKTKTANVTELKEKLRETGVDLDDTRADYLQNEMAQEWLRMQVFPKLRIGLPEMLTFYNLHRNDAIFKQEPEVIWREIVIEPARCKSREDAKAQAEALRDRLGRGEDFATLARSSSHGASAAAGGKQVTTPAPFRDEDLNQALRTLPPGRISPVIATSSSFHIIQVETRKQAGRKGFAEVQDQIRRTLVEQRYEKEAQAYLKKLRDQSTVSTIFEGTASDPRRTSEPQPEQDASLKLRSQGQVTP